LGDLIFPEGESPLCVPIYRESISKSQGGLPWGMHWRKRDYKVRYWRTVNECSFTIVKPTVRWTVDEMKSGAWHKRHRCMG